MSTYAHWKLNDNLANTNVINEKGLDGTLTNAGNTEDISEVGKIDRALHFVPTNDLVNIGLSSMASGAGSIACWIKADVAVPSSARYIIGRNDAGAITGDFGLRLDTAGKIHMFGTSTAGNPSFLSDAVLGDTNWHWVVITWNGSVTKMYIDNSLQTNTGSAFILNAHVNDTAFTIGNSSPVSAGTWDGLLEDTRLYDYIISSAERSFIYNSGDGTYDEYDEDYLAIAHYKCNDDADTSVVIDSSDNAINGTLVTGVNSYTSEISIVGKINEGFGLDGVTDYVNINNVTKKLVEKNLTVSMWFRTSTTDAKRMFSFNTSASGTIWQAGVYGGVISVYDGVGNDGTTAVDDGAWHHVVYEVDLKNSTFKVYLDNNAIPEISFSFSTAVVSTDFCSIGQEYDAGTTPSDEWIGDVDDVRIYNYLLTTDSRDFIYNSGSGTEDDLQTGLYTITFTEQNALDGVNIAIYSDSARTIPVVGSPLTTAGGGIATIDLENETYYYTASKVLYVDVEDSFLVDGDDVDIDFTIKMTEELSPQLEWQTKNSDIQITPTLEWLTKHDDIQKTPSLEWLSKPEHRFCPNLINFEFDFSTPTIYNSKNTATVSGILHSLTINMKNTGTSGSTIIELYVDSVLVTTKTITADNDEYKDIEYFDMTDLIFPEDTLEVKVTQVAVDCSDLKIGVFEMTFPFALEKSFMGNTKDTIEIISINRDYLFNNADYWTIDFNQPINSVSLVTGTNVNGDTVNLTNEIIDGDFYNSRIKITPYLLSTIEKISIKAKDLNNKNYSFILYPTITNYMSDYPFYVYNATETIEIFTPATYYQYSFDSGSTWSAWGTISSSNTMDIDFSAQVEGLKTLTVKYRNATIEFQEDVDIYYVTGEISCEINYVKKYATLSYTDDVPLDRVEIYYDDVLVDTLELDILRGMDTVTLNESAKTITVNAGYLYSDNQTFYFDGAVYDMIVPTDISILNARYIFAFNTNTKIFEWQIDTAIYVSDAEDVKLTGYIIIAIVDVRINPEYDFVNWEPIEQEIFSNISNLNRFDLDLDSSKEIKITVIDVAEREKDFSSDYTLTKFNIWRELTVTRANVLASNYTSTHYPKYLYDVTSTSLYWASSSLPAWNSFECGLDNKKTLKEYSVTPYSTTVDGLPKSWKIQGSNDADTWVDLHEVTNEVSWTSYTAKTYTVTNDTAYAFYRIYVTAVVSGTAVTIGYLNLKETSGGATFAVYADVELLPGEIHQSASLDLDVDSEDWELDDMNGAP